MARTKTKKEPLHLSIIMDKLTDLGWDYQCLTTSGKETYDEIMVMFGVLEEGEHWNEI